MTAARPWKNWNTPTVARMTPAKTVSPPAQAFLVPDAGPAVAGGLVVGADVSAADGEVIGCFSFCLERPVRNSSRPAGEPLVECGCHFGPVGREPLIATGSRVGESLRTPDTRSISRILEIERRKPSPALLKMRDRPNQSVITVRPIGSERFRCHGMSAENTSHFGIKSSDHPTRSWLRLPRSGCPRAPGPCHSPPRGLALQRVQPPAPGPG